MLTRSVLALSVTAALLGGGCADQVDGSGTSAPQAPFPRTSAQLSNLMTSGTRSVHSAHIVLDTNIGSAAVTATGDEQVQDGKATAVSITEQVPGFGALQLRVLDQGTVYVKDPRRASSPKPWVHVTSATTDPVLQQIYSSFQSSTSLGSLESLPSLLRASDGLRLVGTDTIDGATVGHYTFVVETAKLPADFPGRDAVIGAGVTQIPVELYVDHEGRARKGSESVPLPTSKVTIGFELSRFNVPVHITAPPPSQTGN